MNPGELATARAFRLAMEALDRRRAAILAARACRLCATCNGTRRVVAVDNRGERVERCRACAGAGLVST